MERKGFSAAAPEDCNPIVHIHNIVNEQCWQQVLAWEAMNPHECEISLKRFRGRPDDLSPKAWIMTHLLGYRRPFDRHDWIVDRCGKEVRYVIDFYPGRPIDGIPASFYLDVRPALDSVEALKNRFRMGLLACRTWLGGGSQ